MSTFNLDQYDLSTEIDLTEEVEVGSEREIIDSGSYLGYITKYIELGNQKNDFDPSKAPAPQFRLEAVVFKRGDDKPHFLNTFDMTLSAFPKSNAKKIFNALNYKEDARHFAQFIGKGFVFKVEKNTTKKGKEVNNLKLENTIAPFNPVDGTPYKLPELKEEWLGIFLFNQPTVETFNALPQFLQEKVINATNFAGSAVEELLNTGKGIEVKQKKERKEDGEAVNEKQNPQVTETPAPAEDSLYLPELPEL